MAETQNKNGQNANVQDSCTVHGFPDSVTLVEEYGHIGHGAILHGCIIRKNVLVGMNSVILDEAEIGENTIIGANSTVKAKAQIPANVLALGSPAKVVRPLEDKEIAWNLLCTLLDRMEKLMLFNDLKEFVYVAGYKKNRYYVQLTKLSQEQFGAIIDKDGEYAIKLLKFLSSSLAEMNEELLKTEEIY